MTDDEILKMCQEAGLDEETTAHFLLVGFPTIEED
jgi:hypothetical protein